MFLDWSWYCISIVVWVLDIIRFYDASVRCVTAWYHLGCYGWIWINNRWKRWARCWTGTQTGSVSQRVVDEHAFEIWKRSCEEYRIRETASTTSPGAFRTSDSPTLHSTSCSMVQPIEINVSYHNGKERKWRGAHCWFFPDHHQTSNTVYVTDSIDSLIPPFTTFLSYSFVGAVVSVFAFLRGGDSSALLLKSLKLFFQFLWSISSW